MPIVDVAPEPTVVAEPVVVGERTVVAAVVTDVVSEVELSFEEVPESPQAAIDRINRETAARTAVRLISLISRLQGSS
ncbi:MAG: hypothetical protein AB7L13_06065 [Acidimicrobiia bacterium]